MRLRRQPAVTTIVPLLVLFAALATSSRVSFAEELVFDFEDGKGQDWQVVDGEIPGLISNRKLFHHSTTEPYNKQGDWFLSTLESATPQGEPNDTQRGIVESPVFRINGDKLSFLVGGGKHANTAIALVDTTSGKTLKSAHGENAQQMRRVEWDVKQLQDRPVVLRVIDQNPGSWGHITLDDVRLAGGIDEALTTARRANLSQLAKQQPVEPAGWKISHGLLATGKRTYIRSAEGEIAWSYPHSTRDGWVLPNGNILLALSKSKQFPGGGAIEVTREGEKLFEYKGTQGELNSVQKTSDGTYVITEAGPQPRLLELDAEGKILVEFPLQCQKGNVHMQTRMARKLDNGNYLAPHLLDFAVKEYSPVGKVVRSIATDLNGREVHDWPFTAIRLKNGNTLIGCTHGNKVIEVDKEDKVVWQVSNDDLPSALIADACGVQRLPNGNTVITSYRGGPKGLKLLEVTPKKELVWTLEDPKLPGIHHFQILDTDGKPLAEPAMK